MVKIPVGFMYCSLECCLAVIMIFCTHSVMHIYIFHKYDIPHFICPIDRAKFSEVWIGGVAIICSVSGVGAGGEWSGAPFGDGVEENAGGGGDDVFELDVGLIYEVGDRYNSSCYESLAFFSAGTGDEGDGVVAPNGTIGAEIDVPHRFVVTGK